MIKNITTTPLSIIETQGGKVMHAMKKSDQGFKGFGEAYFSFIDFQEIKAWKRHTEMTLNLIVPKGEIRFVFIDDTVLSNLQFYEVVVSQDNYSRLTVPPMVWMGFQGLSTSGSFLLNLANIEHNINEVDNKKQNEFEFIWSV
jgi:dTDP-4-dehydrorhamnose 3,5-epimerase